MKAPRNFWLFVIAGGLELLVGMGLALYIGTSHSWLYGALLGFGFFISANIMFMIALKKLS